MKNDTILFDRTPQDKARNRIQSGETNLRIIYNRGIAQIDLN